MASDCGGLCGRLGSCSEEGTGLAIGLALSSSVGAFGPGLTGKRTLASGLEGLGGWGLAGLGDSFGEDSFGGKGLADLSGLRCGLEASAWLGLTGLTAKVSADEGLARATS